MAPSPTGAAPARRPGRPAARPWVDATVAVVAAVVAGWVVLGTDPAVLDDGLRAPGPVAVLLTAAGAAGTGLWRRQPTTGLALVGVAATVLSASGWFTGVLPFLLMVTLYGVAAHVGRRRALAGLLALAGTLAALVAAGVPDLTPVDVGGSVAVAVAAVAVGDAVRQRREQQAALLAAAELRAEESAARAVADERLRIARELHDVVAHSMSLIAVQAGVGAHVLRRDPAAAERALEVIADTSRAALAQTRSVVGLLRSGDDGQPSVPGLASLEALVQGVREAGVPVELVLDGLPGLTAVVDLAAYRVVQEALTNAVRHDPGTPVRVVLRGDRGELVVDVRSAGTGAPSRAGTSGGGFGLLGLHERARAVGGRLEAGPSADGGFRVLAHLPAVAPA